jgi:hypothetical protein
MRKLRRCVRALSVIALGFVMLVPVMMILPSPARAADSYYETFMPSSYNSTYWKVYPRYTSSAVAAYGIQVTEDSQSRDLYTSSIVSYLETNDFSNPSWTGKEYWGSLWGEMTGELPPDNGTATISSVWVVAEFTLATPPDFYLAFSIDDKASWNVSSTYHGDIAGFHSLTWWNVTSLKTWNATILNSEDFWVRYVAETNAYVHYYFEYLGIMVQWSVPWGGEGGETPEGGEPGGGDLPWSYSVADGGIIGVFGVVGLCGLIATPAWAAWSFKNSDDSRVVVFVKAIVVGMFSLSLFLVSFA